MYFEGDYIMWMSSAPNVTAQASFFFFGTGTKITFGQKMTVYLKRYTDSYESISTRFERGR